ncbi:hypothetical protein ACQ27_gp452 [Klebsiella phage K64-1]|uniref:hypothetical protein n=1 Tax=Klebsiella phage K64-1 TaxID=1439894 RepID=UPI00248C05D6|nr:hypothetical protein ACQ27_gp452 [Klebsiella phage K64-1]
MIIVLSEKEKKLVLSVLKEYPRNMREPFETNSEFEEHLNDIDLLISKIESQ